MPLAHRTEPGTSRPNEDCCFSLQEAGLFVVCDGLSMKAGGAQAAQMAVEAIALWLGENQELVNRARETGEKSCRQEIEHSLGEAISQLSRTIFQKAATQPELHGMCVGVDMILLLGSHALVGHVGAGRCFLVREAEAHLLTEDHTLYSYLRRTGKLEGVTPQQLATYSKRLTRAVGFQDGVKTDFLQVELEGGDRFVCVTDGVWQTLGEGTTFDLVAQAGDPAALVEAVHQRVKDVGAKDDFSTLVLDPELASTVVAAGAEQKIKMLGQVPAFEYLTYQDLMRVLSVADLVKAPAGHVLCREGDPGEELMLVISGSASIVKAGKPIRALGKGDVVGEMSMIDAAPRSATVTTTGATNLLAFPRSSLFALFREDPALAVKFLWGVTMVMNRKLRIASNQLVGRPDLEGVSTEKNGPLPFPRGN